ncbi:TetR/AcrR family transcriptional regulator [Acaryochloris sp. IP29b_bin.148]|uniref:TetR/AcrR family transcriptional regulator n=1 Tax=Acaryochloris sp. IP29b_bin.148 TaxID=2969218 RepID=UPI00260A54EE|nr:TetR/AcrR family transcriptional regulator [Acaryochloris sp. IP29b_bin.148]
MPYQDRRLEVSEAAWQVIVREGLDRTSMRAIAQEMGCTTGVVTHYFRDKQELILFALNQVTERLNTAIAQASESVSGAERLVFMLSAFLPCDVEQKDTLRVWLAFLGYAVGRENLMTEHQRSATRLRAVLVNELKTLQTAHLLRHDVDPTLEANALLALVNGLSLDSLIQANCLTIDQQKQAIQRYVDGLLIDKLGSTHAGCLNNG